MFSLRLLVAVLCVLSITNFAPAQECEPPSYSDPAAPLTSVQVPDDIEQALWWLADDTEAVVVSRGNVPIPGFRRVPPPANAPSVPSLAPVSGYMFPTRKYDYQDLVAMNCIEPLVYFQALYPGDVRYQLINSFYGGRTAKLFIKAVRWDSESTKEMCDLVVFSDKTPSRIIDSLAAFRSVPRKINDVKVLEVGLNSPSSPQSHPTRADSNGEPQAERRWLAAPDPTVYVSTTSLDLLKVIIERMRRRGASRALPATLPEWRQLNIASPAWGLRHYRRDATGAEDSLSMLKWDPKAEGLVFYGNNRPSPFLVLRYLSSTQDAGSRFLCMQRDWLTRFPIRSEDASKLAACERIGPGCFESRTRINVSPHEVQGKPFTNLSVDATFFFCMDSMYLPWLGFSRPKIALNTD